MRLSKFYFAFFLTAAFFQNFVVLSELEFDNPFEEKAVEEIKQNPATQEKKSDIKAPETKNPSERKLSQPTQTTNNQSMLSQTPQATNLETYNEPSPTISENQLQQILAGIKESQNDTLKTWQQAQNKTSQIPQAVTKQDQQQIQNKKSVSLEDLTEEELQKSLERLRKEKADLERAKQAQTVQATLSGLSNEQLQQIIAITKGEAIKSSEAPAIANPEEEDSGIAPWEGALIAGAGGIALLGGAFFLNKKRNSPAYQEALEERVEGIAAMLSQELKTTSDEDTHKALGEAHEKIENLIKALGEVKDNTVTRESRNPQRRIMAYGILKKIEDNKALPQHIRTFVQKSKPTIWSDDMNKGNVANHWLKSAGKVALLPFQPRMLSHIIPELDRYGTEETEKIKITANKMVENFAQQSDTEGDNSSQQSDRIYLASDDDDSSYPESLASETESLDSETKSLEDALEDQVQSSISEEQLKLQQLTQEKDFKLETLTKERSSLNEEIRSKAETLNNLLAQNTHESNEVLTAKIHLKVEINSFLTTHNASTETMLAQLRSFKDIFNATQTKTATQETLLREITEQEIILSSLQSRISTLKLQQQSIENSFLQDKFSLEQAMTEASPQGRAMELRKRLPQQPEIVSDPVLRWQSNVVSPQPQYLQPPVQQNRRGSSLRDYQPTRSRNNLLPRQDTVRRRQGH